MTLYNVLGWVHQALITDAGVLIVLFAPYLRHLFDAPFKPKPISLAFGLGYVVCDLIRLPYLHGAVVSMGFPLIFLTLLVDSPFIALISVALGSWVSEALRSRFFTKQRLPWFPALRRAFFYAGHHAVAGLGALIAHWFVSERFPPWPELPMGVHALATLAYVVVYSLVSMLLMWPHDRRIRLFLAPDEGPFVRVNLMTLLLLPIPASVFYIYTLDVGDTAKALVVVSVLPPLFLALFLFGRHFAKTEEERERLALREEIERRLDAPANMGEMVQVLLGTAGRLVDYRWGAVYSLTGERADEGFSLCGVKPHNGPIVQCEESAKESSTSGRRVVGVDENQVMWPATIKGDEGILVELARQDLRPQFFDDGLTPATSSDPYLPGKTALIAFPIETRPREREGVESRRLIGLVALARPKRMFTTRDWDKGQALGDKAGNVLFNVQRLGRTLQELSQKVEDYTRHPERVREAMQELIRRQVDVSKILAVISERSFHQNLQAVLRGVVEGERGDGIPFTDQELAEIYDQVRDETPGMSPINPQFLQLLRTMTSSLSLAFSFRYQFPEMERGPAFKEFYQLLLAALNANTVPRIANLGAQIASVVGTVRQREGERWAAPEVGSDERSTILVEAIEEVERLQDVVGMLKECEGGVDLTDRRVSLGQALEVLGEREGAVQERLRDPERFVFRQLLSGWRSVITKALEDLARGPARLRVELRSDRALPLEETTVGLVLRNEGPGVASSVVVQLEPSGEYEVLKGRVDLGILVVDKEMEPEFTLRPAREGPLRPQFRITYDDPERKGKVEEFADFLYLREPPPCFGEIPNPYIVGKPLKPGDPTFVGRDDVFALIQRRLTTLAGERRVLVLVGERRTGKTSVLKHLSARLDAPFYIPVYIDGNALGIDTGMENFFLSLATAITDGLEAVGISVPRLMPEGLQGSPKYVFERRFLPAVREQIGEHTLLFAIDEFEDMGSRVQSGRLPGEVFPYLRHMIQHEERMAFIFAGTHKIEELIGDYWSVLFNIAEYRQIGFLNREETVRLITEPVQPYGMVYDDLAIDEILRLAACHPYFTQLLCSVLVDHCNEKHCNYVTVQHVRDAVEELLEVGRAHLVFLWDTSEREARLVLAALAELRERLDRVSAAAIADQLDRYQVGISLAQVTEAMGQLVGREIVREISGNPVVYDFTAQLYGQWLRRYRSLSKIVEG